jgi:glycosyltransferase involved in cell wall biosynthesis
MWQEDGKLNQRIFSDHPEQMERTRQIHVMKNSMHIIGSRLSGGAEMFYLRLIKALSETGHEVVAVNRRHSMVSSGLGDGIQQYHVGMYNVRDPLSRYLITRLIERTVPDIVQTYMGRATRLTRVPRGGATVHVSRLGGFYKLDGYRHADAWVGNTRSICDYLTENGFPAKRVFHIPNFVEVAQPGPSEYLKELKSSLGVPGDAIVILGVGRLMEKKGFRYLVEAVSLLPESISERPLHLVVVGSGPLEEDLISYTSSLGLGRRIHWAGWQTDPGPYYGLADIFVCPSLHEPLGNVILEAWSHGKPVVSTMTHGAEELITDGVNGLLVPCAEPRILASVLETALQNSGGTLTNLSAEGLLEVHRKYSKETVVRSYLSLYDELKAAGKLS